MFGGSDPAIQGLIPSDIVVRRNQITRPTSWRGVWPVKNLLELKNGMRVLYEGNVLENNWADAQSGFMVVFQTLTDDNGAAWVRVQDITLRNNVFRNSDQGINIAYRAAYGSNPLLPTEGTKRIVIRNNLMVNTRGTIFQTTGELDGLQIENNTAFGVSHTLTFDSGTQTRLRVVNNVFGRTEYGIYGNSAAEGNTALARYAPDAVVTGNAMIGKSSSLYPAGNFFPTTADAIGYGGLASGGYTIGSSSPARVTLGGQLIGADLGTIASLTSGVVR